MNAKKIHDNPTAEQLRAFTEEMPTCRITEFDNVNVQTRVTSRSTGSTYVVTEDPAATSQKAMPREEFERLARTQDEFIARQEMLVIDGSIGNDPDFRTRARLSIERANANIAGMQQRLYFAWTDPAEPEVQVIYTPNLSAPGYPDDRCIAVDLEHAARNLRTRRKGVQRCQERCPVEARVHRH